MKGIRKAIVLSRVSTELQDNEPQTSKLTKWATDVLGYDEVRVIETKESGLLKTADKKGTKQLISLIESNPEYKSVIISEVSRLGRMESVTHTIKDFFIEKGIQLHIYELDLHLFKNQEKGQLDESVLDAFSMQSRMAAREIRSMKERLFTGQLNALKKNVSIPGKVTFGYKAVFEPITKKKKWELSENSEIVQNIYNWYEHGLPDGTVGSTNKIAKYCIKKDLPSYTHSKRNINKLLSEKAYTGRKEFYFEKQKESVTISYPQIISLEQFQRVQELKKKANTTKDKSRHTTILSSLIRCTECKTFLTANYRLKGVYDSSSYRCGARSKAIPCGNKINISVNMIDSAVWSLLKSSGSVRKNINTEDYERIYTETEREMNKIIQDVDNIGKTISNLKSIANSLSAIASIDDLQGNENYQETEESTKELDNKILRYKELLDKKIEEKNSINLKLQELENKISLVSNFETEHDVDYQDENLKIRDAHENSNNNLKIGIVEQSKSEVRKYIKHFIREISIVFHSKKTTVAEILFKYPLFFELWGHEKFEDYFRIDIDYPAPVYLIIDKDDTNRLKLFWCRKFSHTKIKSSSITTKSKFSNQTMTFDFNDFHSKSEKSIAALDEFFFKIQYHPLKLR